MSADPLARLEREVVACERCPRLIDYCRTVAVEKKRAHRDDDYWGRPVPGFGDPAARLLIVGLAPAAHGANRTGRMFTGDGPRGSSTFLAEALHAVGLANRATSDRGDDDLELRGAFLTAICRCAPPANKPTSAEIAACAPFLLRELDLLTDVRTLLCLGKLAWDQVLRVLAARGAPVPRPRPKFAHAARFAPGAGLPTLVASYHVSRQNTQTGRLTQAMFRAVLRDALR